VASSAPAPDPAAKSGYYTVKQGDTLIRIGLDHGQNWRDIMRWNALENPNLIEVGQVLRVAPPSVNAASEEVVVKPVTPPGNVAGSQVEAKPNPQNQAPAANTPAPEVSEEQLTFMWPVQGNVLAGFDDAKNKGIDIGGKLGEPVLASADGKVVYAGSGLRGYGNLVILKHNNTYLTAYAHNQTLLVKEDQQVKRGQKIAEMGNSDSEQVKLHFEIRKLGKPVDPAKLLAPR
jgi:lipoprotein NlpD